MNDLTDHAADTETVTSLTTPSLPPSADAAGLGDLPPAPRQRARWKKPQSHLSPAMKWARKLRRSERFAEVALHVGRLTKLYGDVKAIQLKTRLGGAGAGVHANLKLMLEFGALKRKGAGRYDPLPIPCEDTNEQVILLASALYAGGCESMPLADLLRHPLLFPFTLPDHPEKLATTQLLGVSYEGGEKTVTLPFFVTKPKRVRPKKVKEAIATPEVAREAVAK